MGPGKFIPTIVILMLGLLAGYLLFAPKEIYLSHQCDLNKTGTCLLKDKDSGTEAMVSISPYPIRPLDEITYTLKLKGVDPERITTRVLGHSMEMPEEQVFTLEKSDVSTYQATRAFPTCTEEEMKWGLYFVIKGKKKWARTLFNIVVTRNPK